MVWSFLNTESRLLMLSSWLILASFCVSWWISRPTAFLLSLVSSLVFILLIGRWQILFLAVMGVVLYGAVLLLALWVRGIPAFFRLGIVATVIGLLGAVGAAWLLRNKEKHVAGIRATGQNISSTP